MPPYVVTERLAFPCRCSWTVCRVDFTFFAVNGDPLCMDHAAKTLGRLMWDLRIAALIDFVKANGFDELPVEGRAEGGS